MTRQALSNPNVAKAEVRPVLCNNGLPAYCHVRQRIGVSREVEVLQVEHNPSSGVHATHICEAQVTHTLAESTGIDRHGLFSQHVVGAASQVDSGSWPDWTTTTYREPDCS
jgi:hypothetical protein